LTRITLTKKLDNNDVYSIFFAASLYLPTIFLFPHWTYIFAIILAAFKLKYYQFYQSDLLVFYFAFFSIINNIYGLIAGIDLSETSFSFLGVPLIIVMLIMARIMDHNIVKWLILFIFIEALVVIFESYIGKQYIFDGQYWGQTIYKTDLLYYNRPFGLSSNSSDIGQKIFLGLLLFFYFNIFKDKLTSYFWGVVFFILNIALILNLNRASMLAVFTMYLLILVFHLFLSGFSRRSILYFFVFTSCILFFVFNYADEFIFQITRGGMTIDKDITSRRLLWETAIQHILNNPFFGNNSITYRISLLSGGNLENQHAHNSFLMLLATHGILVAIPLIIYTLSKIKRYNIPYVFPIFVYSFFQYGIFWNMSLMDIVFFTILIGYSGSDGALIRIAKKKDT